MYKIICIAGATGTGKDEYLYSLNEKLNFPVLIVDSMKVYRLMDIGTSKPAPIQLNKYIHFGINIRNHWETFNVAMFSEYVKNIFSKFNYIIAVAGSPLYLKVILHGIFHQQVDTTNIREKLLIQAEKEGIEYLYNKLKILDPVYASKISSRDKKRIIRALEIIEATGKRFSDFHTHFKEKPIYRTLVIGISEEKENLKKYIEYRTKKIIGNGIIDEVKILKKIADFSPQAKEAIGYKDTIYFLEKEQSIEELEKSINKNTIRYIKHQLTWFKKMVDIWLPRDEKTHEEIKNHVFKFLEE